MQKEALMIERQPRVAKETKLSKVLDQGPLLRISRSLSLRDGVKTVTCVPER